MLGAAIDLKLAIDRASEAIVWDHSLHGTLDEKFWATRTTLAEGLGFVSSDKPGKTHVGLLGFFLSADLDVGGIDHDDEITRVDVCCVNGLVFTTKEIGGLDGNVAQMLVFGIYDPPTAFDFGGFGGKGLHTNLGKVVETRKTSP